MTSYRRYRLARHMISIHVISLHVIPSQPSQTIQAPTKKPAACSERDSSVSRSVQASEYASIHMCYTRKVPKMSASASASASTSEPEPESPFSFPNIDSKISKVVDPKARLSLSWLWRKKGKTKDKIENILLPSVPLFGMCPIHGLTCNLFLTLVSIQPQEGKDNVRAVVVVVVCRRQCVCERLHEEYR
jgi:hypothetical protein